MQTKSQKNEAKLKNNSGLMLLLPKNTNAPLLFLEWLSQQKNVTDIIHKVIDSDTYIKIRLNCIKETYIDCLFYINSLLR